MSQKKKASSFSLRSLPYDARVAPYVFILPFILIFGIFFAYPIVNAFVMSFQELLPGQITFIGWDNYKQLASDTVFRKACTNSITYTFWTLLLLVPCPLIFATLLNQKALPFRNLYRSILFIPALTSVVVAGITFKLMLSEVDTSLFNSLLHLFGQPSIKWMKRADTGMMAMVMVACWRWTGVNIMYYMAGLQNISEEIYESVDIDGGNAWQKFRYITVPLLKPTTIYVLTISIYGSMAMFIESYMLYEGNKSIANNGLTIVGYLYRKGLQQNNLGYGAAVGVFLLLVVFIVNMAQLNLFGMFRKEEGSK